MEPVRHRRAGRVADGAGVSSLIRLVQEPGEVAGGSTGALQALAMIADDRPEARAFLLEQVKKPGLFDKGASSIVVKKLE